MHALAKFQLHMPKNLKLQPYNIAEEKDQDIQ